MESGFLMLSFMYNPKIFSFAFVTESLVDKNTKPYKVHIPNEWDVNSACVNGCELTKSLWEGGGGM